jgi:DNA polymerase-3 subunit delta
MALIKRTELAGKMAQLLPGTGPRLFLFFGERYLCRKAVEHLQKSLLDQHKGIICSVDGDQEDAGQTLAKLMSFSLLPGLQIFHVNDTRLFHSKNISKTIWDKCCRAFKANRLNQAAKYLFDMYSLAAIAPDDRRPLTDLTEEQWQELFGMQKPADLSWTSSLLDEINNLNTKASTPSSIAEKYMGAFDRGLPPNNILILTAETIDKRKKFFTYIKKNGLVVDCSVAVGGGAAAQKVQKSILQEMIQKTLAGFKKTIDPRALEVFFERVGFHPVAVVMETEKLALYCGDRPNITLQDLDKMVGRSREDALFELTDHFSKRLLSKTLTSLHHLLDNGIHSLAIIATMRNFVRKLLIFRSMQLQPAHAYNRGMGAKQFQESYLPAIREKEEWKDLLKGHPYALYMSFAKAAEFKCATLKSWLELILTAEFQLKGSNLPQKIVLEQLIVSMMKVEK